jgi:hypothetical protein
MFDMTVAVARKEELHKQIKHYRKTLFLILDFAIGYKKLSRRKITLRDPYGAYRLACTLKSLHAKKRELQKEYRLLSQVIAKHQGKST